MDNTKIEVVTVELDPAVWYRGHSHGSRLLTYDDVGMRRQCCIGIACSAMGISDRRLRSKSAVSDLSSSKGLGFMTSLADGTIGAGESSELAYALYSINDRGVITDGKRIEKLNERCARAKLPLRFTLKAEAR